MRGPQSPPPVVLVTHGVGRGDTVALMAPNIPEAFEAHFGVPMAGAVLNALNIRLDPDTIAFILGHGEAKVLITDTEFTPVIDKALRQLDRKPLVIDIDDMAGPGGARLGDIFATLATHDNSASRIAAFFRSAVSNPSVNQP